MSTGGRMATRYGKRTVSGAKTTRLISMKRIVYIGKRTESTFRLGSAIITRRIKSISVLWRR